MSAQATGNVWKYAECHGSKLVVLLAVADIANDVHNNEVWIGSGKLAEKCRMDPRNVRRRLKELVEDGWLIQLQLGGGMGKPSRYQFVPQDETGSFNPVDEVDETGSERSCSGSYNPVNRVTPPDLPGHTARPIYNSIETKGELKELNDENDMFSNAGYENNGRDTLQLQLGPDDITDIDLLIKLNNEAPATSELDLRYINEEMFDEFWRVYDRKEKKEEAKKSWGKHIKDFQTGYMVIEKAREYAASREKQFRLHPNKWINGKCWNDEIVETRKLTNSEETMINLRKVAEEQGLI